MAGLDDDDDRAVMLVLNSVISLCLQFRLE